MSLDPAIEIIVQPPDGATVDSDNRTSVVTAATVLAFVAFLVVDALAGEPAAGIVFLAVLFGLVLVLPVVVLIARRSRQLRRTELETVASLAAELAVRELRERAP